MDVKDTPLAGLKIVQPKKFGDARGFFVERFNADKFAAAGLPTAFVQDNHSQSAPGVVRGLHYQNNPPQGKLVGCTTGRIWDVAVDIRPESKTFGQHFGIELSGDNATLLWIPAGFAHGFCVLGNAPADVIYKVTAPWNQAGEGGIRFDDADLKINWPVSEPVLSDRDRKLPMFKDVRL